MLFFFLYFSAFLLAKSCDIQKTSVLYYYDDVNDCLLANYTTTVTDSNTGEVTKNVTTKTINAGPILGLAKATTTETTTTETTTTPTTTTTESWVKKSCASGWTLSNRTNYLYYWCYKLFTGVMNQTAAEDKCVAKGAHLSGLLTYERITIATAMAAMLTSSDNGSIWIGMVRYTNFTSTEISNLMWIDGTTSNSSITKNGTWTAGNPDNLGDAQPCVVMYVFKDNNTAYHGLYDDMQCDTNAFVNSTIPLAGYICGKPAT